jgi:hypothetical protein
MYYSVVQYNIDANLNNESRQAATEFIHYIHGRNPLNMTYLSNMYKYGGKNCVNEFYHTWFSNNSPRWDRVGKSLSALRLVSSPEALIHRTTGMGAARRVVVRLRIMPGASPNRLNRQRTNPIRNHTRTLTLHGRLIHGRLPKTVADTR